MSSSPTIREPQVCVLVVEDEADMAEILRFNLTREGYACRVFSNGKQALDEIRRNPPDLILLDRMLPGLSGDEIAASLRATSQTANIPILMLTAKSEDADELVGFALGASDYVSKPFNIKVLLARMAALLRRTAPSETSSTQLTVGPIALDESRHEVRVGGQPTPMTATEFRILRTLMAAQGRVLDRGNLIDSVLGPMVAVTDRTIDVHIAGLRKKLGAAKDWVQTVRGVGYTFRPPEEAGS